MNCAHTTKALIIGYGNSLRSDDAVGLHIARKLAAAGYQTIETCQLLPELAEKVAQADLVVFVDCYLDIPPGHIRVGSIPTGGPQLHSPCSPAQLLTLAKEVYGAEPEAFFVGVGPTSLDLGESLSPLVWAAIPQAVAAIESLIKGRYCAGAGI